MIKVTITRLPGGRVNDVTIAYRKKDAEWVPVFINDHWPPAHIIHEVIEGLKKLIETNGVKITHFEYDLKIIKFFKEDGPCYCKGSDVDVFVLKEHAQFIEEHLEKISELL